VIVYLMAATGAGARRRLDDELRAESLDPAQDAGVAGGADEIAAGVRRWAAAGAGTVVLQPTADEPDLEGFIRFAARDVGSLLSSSRSPDSLVSRHSGADNGWSPV
jgi:alkanesulfonate monooxygenase SsuD/methylene tetrahydromethanopterin reductase-like flavin-dependent oxidoreductase (luciferase family)